MLCQLCKKREASVCINVDMNGVKTQQFICELCAEKHKLRENPSGEAILSLLGEIKKAEAERESQSEQQYPDTMCYNCGMQYKDFKKYGQVGCPKCYDAFTAPLSSIIKKITHQDTVEVSEEESKKPNKLMLLQLQLKRCIENENYEEAAKIRDSINELRSKEQGDVT